MRHRKPLLIRGLATGVMAMGLLGATALPAAAEELCTDQPILAAADGNGDGLASVAEIRAIAPDNAELQAAADQLEGQGYSGIRYNGCADGGAGSGDGGAGSGDGGAGSGDGATGSGGAATGDGGGAGTGDGGGAATGNGGGAGTGGGTGNGSASAGTGDGGTGVSVPGGTGSTASAANVVISRLPSVGHGTSAVSGWSAAMMTLALGLGSILALGAAVTLRKRAVA